MADHQLHLFYVLLHLGCAQISDDTVGEVKMVVTEGNGGGNEGGNGGGGRELKVDIFAPENEKQGNFRFAWNNASNGNQQEWKDQYTAVQNQNQPIIRRILQDCKINNE